jgi:hypothetical protein
MLPSLQSSLAIRFRNLLQTHNRQLRLRRPVPLRADRGRTPAARLVKFIVAFLVVQNFLITGVLVSNWRQTTSETSGDENRNDDNENARKVERSIASLKDGVSATSSRATS